MKVLVTGGAGFIGSQLVDKLLDESHEVVCVDNFHLGKPEFIKDAKTNALFHFYEHDLLDLESLKKIFEEHNFEMVFHLAANSDIEASLQSTDRDLKLTFQLTYNVLECMRLFNVKKLFFTSTGAVFGNHDSALTEDLPMNPESLYGASKLASEAFIRAFSSLYGFQSWILRLSNMVGQRPTHGILFDFLKKIHTNKNQLIVLGDGNQNKPYMHVTELLDCIFFLIDNAKENINVYNVGPKDTIKVSEIAKIFLKVHGTGQEIFYTGGKIGWKGDQPVYSHNSKKLNLLGWSPKLSSREAIEMAIKDLI